MLPAARKTSSRKTSSRKTAPRKTAARAPAARTNSAAPPARTSRSAGKPAPARLTLEQALAALERAGSEQTRKTYRRHGAEEPLFGVSFAELKTLVKRIGVDHELALALWQTKNHDARVLALKIADPARIRPADLDRWARELRMRMCKGYVAMLASESPHAVAKAREWTSSSDPALRATGWTLSGMLAHADDSLPDEPFLQRVAQIEKSIHAAPNAEKEAMNMALITLGGRNATLRKAALAAARSIGKLEVDHGDTDCKTPDAATYIEKMWAHAQAKKFASPAAQERARDPMRTRC